MTPFLTPCRVPTFFAVGVFLFASFPVFARVGETRGTFEQRLLRPSVGKIFFRSKDQDNTKGKRAAERGRQKEEAGRPFNEAQPYFPEDADEVVYWKSAESGHLSNDNGWKIHVFYMGGRSALEAYHREGHPLNEFEVRALLALNKGASSWKKVPVVEGREGEKPAETEGLPYDFELEDGSLRAKQQGDWLMIYSVRLNTFVIERQKVAKERKAREDEVRKREQQGAAPESVMGF